MTKLALLALLIGACSTTDSDDAPECTGGKCDGGGTTDQSCSDTRYGDGTCNLDLACAVPDIDCFRTFSKDSDAATWWNGVQQTELHENDPIIPESDPRWIRVRAALDKGWAAFKSHRPVGKLAEQRPALVLVDKALEHAAFVYTDTTANTQPFAVMVETGGLASGADDDALLGVMMHELQHAVGLHNMGTNASKIRRYYVAPSGQEPMGREQPDDADLRYVTDTWIDAAGEVGPYSQIELGGLPLSGELQQVLGAAVRSGLQSHAAQCQPVVDRIDQITSTISGAANPIDSSLPADLSGVDTAIDSAMSDLASDCLADFPYGFIDVAATVGGVTPAQIEAALTPHDLALVKDVPFVDGLTALTTDRRETMRTAEGLFNDATGEPWTQARYFSNEEDADDVSTIVMHAAGLDPTSIASFFRAVLGASTRTACEQALTDGLPGYGVDLTDTHHAVCWRIGHVTREAATFRARPVHAPIPHVLHAPSKLPTRDDPHHRIMD